MYYAFILGRPAFSIDSLLQRKVVHNHQVFDKNQNEDKIETSIESKLRSSTMVSRGSSHSTIEGAISIPPSSNNPLESLTFENILKSAAIQQHKNKGRNKIKLADRIVTIASPARVLEDTIIFSFKT